MLFIDCCFLFQT